MKKKKNKPIGCLLSILIIIAIIVLGYNSFKIIRDVNGVTLDYDYKYNVAKGVGTNEIAHDLKTANVIKSEFLFKNEAKTFNFDTKITPGEVLIEDGMSYKEILEAMCTQGRDAIELTIPEGYELSQIKELCVEKGICTNDEFDDALNPTYYDYDFLKSIPKRDNMLEGYLFPDTYFINTSSNIHDVIDLMLSEFDKQYNSEYIERTKELNMTIDEVITLASIVERETDVNGEREKVAGVFYNRLEQNMPLQSCATVQYILKERKAILSEKDTKIQSPYNTYIHQGLPIGPIASPGIECIKAVLYPTETDALYFVLGKDGKHIFSKTYEEHLKAIEESQN